jgi:DNA-binding NtrC family response regulator
VTVEPHDVELLRDYAWPGNVRELATVIDRAVLLGEGRRIDIARSLNLSPRAKTARTTTSGLAPPHRGHATAPHDAAGSPSAGHAGHTDHAGHADHTGLATHAGHTGHTDHAAHAGHTDHTGHAGHATPASTGAAPHHATHAPASRAGATPEPAPDPATIEPLDDVIRRHVEHALVACKGRIDGPFGIAHKLEVNPHTLRARMRKLGIDWRRHRKA